MAIYRAGQINKLGLTNPGVYVIEELPSGQIVGVPTNIQGIVGVASWGPVGGVQTFASLDSGAGKLGQPLARSHDIMSHAMAAFQMGAALYVRSVRVSDGTDVAAMLAITNAGSFVAKYTGVYGNNIQVTIQPTTQPSAFAVVVSIPGRTPERFDNIAAATPAAFWKNVATVINNGNAQRGPSNYVVFSAATTPTVAPATGTTYTLAGGTDGDTGVVSSTMIGTDIRPRTGMYGLRGTACDSFELADLADPTTWAVQITFAISEGMLAVTTTPSGDTIANAVATRTSQGVDDPSLWIIEGDWPTFYDTVNGGPRLISPQAMAIGLLGNLSPEQSPINKPLTAVLATQTSQQGILTDDADESVAQTGGIDFIGRSSALNVSYFSFMTGRNASSNSQANGVEFTRLENFIARSLNGIATTQLVGLLQSRQLVDPTRTTAAALLNSFGAQLKDPSSGSNGYGLIEDFQTICDKSNNPDASILQGILQATFKAVFLSVVRYFIIDLQGGNSVNITVSPTPTVSGT